MPDKLLIASVAAVLISPTTVTLAQEQGRAQQQTQVQEQIYGSQLMTPQERTDYLARLRAANTVEERERIRAEHHAEMQRRARERGVTLPEMPPAMGNGMGPGASGTGPRGGEMGPGSGRGQGNGGMGPHGAMGPGTDMGPGNGGMAPQGGMGSGGGPRH